MQHRFMRLSSSTGERRWINLDRVTRISLATDPSGDPILVFSFDGHDQIRVHGSDNESRELIRAIAQTLDGNSAGMYSAAA
ncbi:MAG: hypothetical protein U0637_04085 [Phycisphaerales bacterium]